MVSSSEGDLSDWEAISDGESNTPPPAKAVEVEGAGGSESAGTEPKASKPNGPTKRPQAAKERKKDTDKKPSSIPATLDSKLRSPILCVMGHVDTGKTKLLDKLRKTNVGEKEAGGITQQIGASFFPRENLLKQTKKVDPKLDLQVPGLLIIDTPGHASFSNLRKRGSSLCDLAILVVDVMHGMEPQTRESLQMLKQRKCPFIVALNKIDRVYGWTPNEWEPFIKTCKAQKKSVKEQLSELARKCVLSLTEEGGMNFALHFENQDPRRNVSVVPTSAVTGEGLPDLLAVIVKLTQTLMAKQITLDEENVECSVMEVKTVDGFGTTIDTILVGGILKEGDMIVVCGMNEPIVTTIRALLTPHPMKEMRVKGEFVHHKCITAAQGVKIAASNLEGAVAGTSVKVVRDPSDMALIEQLKSEVQEDMSAIFKSIDRTSNGVYVMASTLGALEALLTFLRENKIPVNGINIGTVFKIDVMKASTMRERGHEEYAVVLAFDVKIDPEAAKEAKTLGVTIFNADVIYHLFDVFTKHLKDFQEEQRRQKSKELVFPCILKIVPGCVFRVKDPLIFGVKVDDGELRIGTPLIVPAKGQLRIGTVETIEKDKNPVPAAKRGAEVCIKMHGDSNITIGKNFDTPDLIVSHISRASINVMKEFFIEDLKTHAKLVKTLKGMLNIV